MLLSAQTALAARDSGHGRVTRIDKFGRGLLFFTLTAFNATIIIDVIYVEMFADLLSGID